MDIIYHITNNNTYTGTSKEDHKLLTEIHEIVNINKIKIKSIMATIEEVQQALTDLQTSIDAKQQAIADAIAALEAQIAAGQGATPEQLQGLLDGLKSAQGDVDSTPTA